MSFDEGMREFINKRVAQIKGGAAKKYLQQNVLYPSQQKERDKAGIENNLKKIIAVHSKVIEHVKGLRSLVPDIMGKTRMVAIYLIYGKICTTWETVFLLNKSGFNFEVMELSRSINENLDLIHVFHLDKSNKYLMDWFDGKIIDNKIARQLNHNFLMNGEIAEKIKETGISPYDLMTDVYRGLSKYTHCSYAALLDSLDVFTHDYDWNRYAGFHYSLHNMHQLISTMSSTLITLKLTYGELRDIGNYMKIDKLLIDFAGPHDENTLKNLIPKKLRADNG